MEKVNEPRLRGYLGKKLLSYIRNGDYAHAGEIESIIMVMSVYNKNSERKILDVGCGLGGTADFIQKNGWGKLTGIDIEKEAITYAENKFPHINFYCVDVVDVSKKLQDQKFDLICMFNSFYAFSNQSSALKKLFDISNHKAQLAIFDYSNENNANSIDSFMPININKIESMLTVTGWLLNEIVDVSCQYIKWYSDLLDKIAHHQKLIIAEYGELMYDKALNTYRKLYQSLVEKSLGGVIIYAEKFN